MIELGSATTLVRLCVPKCPKQEQTATSYRAAKPAARCVYVQSKEWSKRVSGQKPERQCGRKPALQVYSVLYYIARVWRLDFTYLVSVTKPYKI